MESIVKDIRYAIRTCLKRPGFTATAIIILAIGIGANSAIFSVVNGVLLKPFNFAEPERLVVVWERTREIPRMVVSSPNFSDWRTQQSTFKDLAAYRLQDFNLIGDGEPERVRGSRVTATMFSLLGVRPMLGRDFRPDEDKPGNPATMITSNAFWQHRFGASREVIGQSVTLGNENVTIIGVMPADFDFPPPITFRGEARRVTVDLWTQLHYELELDQRGGHNLFVLGRLKDGVSRATAEADLQNIARRLAKEFPDTNAGWDAFLVSLNDQVVGDVRSALLILFAAVGFVLLIACSNVGNLLLVKATSRRHEMAIRASLGARRTRLIRQVLIESGLLSVGGGVLGLLLAAWSLKLIAAFAPPNIYRLANIGLDVRVVVFTVVVSLVAALLFGIVPALQSSRLDLVAALKEAGARGSVGSGHSWVRNALVVTELALALLLLTGAGLLVKSFIYLQTVSTGFQPQQVLAMTISMPGSAYPDRQSREAFAERLLPKLKSLPMVDSLAFSDNLPLDTGRQGTSFRIEGSASSDRDLPHTNVSTVSPGYFRTMGIPLLRGRDFEPSDQPDAPGVVIVSKFLADHYFPREDPVGKRLEMGFRAGTMLKIVGIAADERHDTLQADLHPGMYLPYAQASKGLPLIVVLRSANDPGLVSSSVRQQVRELDPRLPVYDVKTMDEVLSAAVARPRFTTLLLVAFGGVAILLAAVGIYGVMSYTVNQSVREIGIRMALGAQAGDVLKLVIGQGLRLTLMGAMIGVSGAFGLTRLMAGLLFEVKPIDPMIFILVPVLLVTIALLACYLPARRATKVDPLVALRYE